jgi:hypothetical protein
MQRKLGYVYVSSPDYRTEVTDRSSENVAEFKYFRATVTNQNCILE